jgi:molybdate/tungstate transport system substrate-binding protein
MKIIRLISPLVFIILFTGCSNQNNQTDKLIVFHAGSLSVPVKQINKAFQNLYPEVEIFAEASGSVAGARKISDLKRPCDVMLSADYNVINKFLIPEYSLWNIKFASNEMVIAFTGNSNRADEITPKNWHEILMDPGIRYGRSDPNADPCGYRTVLCLKLSGSYYEKQGLSSALLQKDQVFIRPKETDLIALLETQIIDYIFIYRSVAVQHGLKFIPLPDSVNLKKPELHEWYKSVSVEINGKKPGEKIVQTGEPMIYGLTIPENAPNPELARAYVKFILEAENGMTILEKNGQPTVVPSRSNTWKYIPDDLKQYALP